MSDSPTPDLEPLLQDIPRDSSTAHLSTIIGIGHPGQADQSILFEGLLNPDGTIALCEPGPGHQLIGVGQIGPDGHLLTATLDGGQVEKIDLAGAALEIVNGNQAATYTVGADGRLTQTSVSTRSAGDSYLQVGGRIVTIPAGSVLTADSQGNVYIDGTLVTQTTQLQGPQATQVLTNVYTIDWSAVYAATGQITADIADLGTFGNKMLDHSNAVYDAATTLQSKIGPLDLQSAFGDALFEVDDNFQYLPNRENVMWSFQVAQAKINYGLHQHSWNLADLGNSLHDMGTRILDTENANLTNMGIPYQVPDPRVPPSHPAEQTQEPYRPFWLPPDS